MASEHDSPERERRVVDLIAQVNERTRAPHALRTRVDELGAGGTGPLGRLRARIAGLAVSGAVAAGLAIVLIGGSAAPSLAQVRALAGRGPAGPAPRIDRMEPALLTTKVGDLHFPDWGRFGGWRASGERADIIAGRSVATVFYVRAGTRLAYSIVASPALPGSPRQSRAYLVRRQGERVSVVWVEQGHTCVLSADDVSAEALWALARTTLGQPS